ncbi:MAG: hypothetical protein CSB32_00030 [Desulfobacterales bacterium]|nr:MAG: hypothetical protein CSB32_00030 [Desulfobacterales bacterium]
MQRIESSITPDGCFRYGIHKPAYKVTNLRKTTEKAVLGRDGEDQVVDNTGNYPETDISVDAADWVYEIPNPLFFKGRTFINKPWADACADDYERMKIPQPAPLSLTTILEQNTIASTFINKLPMPLLLALATTSTDPRDLVLLARHSCELLRLQDGSWGLRYTTGKNGTVHPVIHHPALFEAVANNPRLPGDLKIAMVLRPGAQGGSEIVGEWPRDGKSHIYEYLRRNSYIPGGHYAANMADDAIRYSIADLQRVDLQGLRHLYYQRSFVRLAKALEIGLSESKERLSETELEELRTAIIEKAGTSDLSPATLWGWNLGFDYAPSGYRLHASHQQIHQQYAMVPDTIEAFTNGGAADDKMSAFSCGDLITEVIDRYQRQYQRDFFTDYQRAIAQNSRIDGRSDRSSVLTIFEDERVMLYVPKAQTSQWELQIMTRSDRQGNYPGNIFECDTATRKSLDTALYKAQQALAGIGAKMVTSIEYSKRLNSRQQKQALLYVLLPRLPESPGSFSEAQLRFISGHYPEDFAALCRQQLQI